MPHSKGYRHKTRSLLRRRPGRSEGLTAFLRKYRINDKVVIILDPSQHKGMPHRRYQGLVGNVEEVRKKSLVIRIPVGSKVKKVITRVEHVRPL